MREVKYEELEEVQRRLLDEAAKVMNTAYGSTICAERAAILRTNAKGIRTFDKIGMIGRGRGLTQLK